jgi:hypothetical protein
MTLQQQCDDRSATRGPITDMATAMPALVDCSIGFDERVSAVALRVYLVIAGVAGPNPVTESDEAWVAAGAGTTPLQVRRALVALRALGYLA